MNNLIIIGAGGFGREVAWLASEAINPFRVLGFLDDRIDITAEELGGYELLGTIDSWPSFQNVSFVIAIGSPRTRSAIAVRMKLTGEPRFATLIHRSCMIGPNCNIDTGSMICAGSIMTTQISVGRHSIINIGTTVGHDVNIGHFVTIAPQVAVSGCVTLLDGCEIGTSTAIRQGLSVGKGSMVGMSSSLTKNVPDNMLWYGVPANPIKDLLPFEMP